ncbi:MAG: hypothetical protein AAF581_23670 [Planctomycetota bacterium]
MKLLRNPTRLSVAFRAVCSMLRGSGANTPATAFYYPLEREQFLRQVAEERCRAADQWA